jgi:hypothetical protein
VEQDERQMHRLYGKLLSLDEMDGVTITFGS